MTIRVIAKASNELNECDIKATLEFNMPSKKSLEIAGITEHDYKDKIAKEYFLGMMDFYWTDVRK